MHQHLVLGVRARLHFVFFLFLLLLALSTEVDDVRTEDEDLVLFLDGAKLVEVAFLFPTHVGNTYISDREILLIGTAFSHTPTETEQQSAPL